MREFRRIAFAGDWHANTRFARRMITHAWDQGADCIIHLGDYGWDYSRWFINTIESMLYRTGLELFFIDGNHENFDRLYQFPIQPDGTRKISKRVHHLPRGHRFTWGGVRFLACGGGVSVDRDRPVNPRVEGVSWWPQEEITSQEHHLCETGGPTDVLLSHDCPALVPIPDLDKTAHLFPADGIARSETHRLKLLTIASATRPRLVLHGHYDRVYTAYGNLGWGPMRVVGLDRDHVPTLNHPYWPAEEDNMLVVDVAELASAVQALNATDQDTPPSRRWYVGDVADWNHPDYLHVLRMVPRREGRDDVISGTV